MLLYDKGKWQFDDSVTKFIPARPLPPLAFVARDLNSYFFAFALGNFLNKSSTAFDQTELCPAHRMTPIYSAQGPTASLYWCAIIREI
jgi:hypothetical protein